MSSANGNGTQQINRLEAGGHIDRAAPLSFTFNGKGYRGYRGDTLAAALLANGVDVVGRSFKYSRPRGIVAAGSEEPNAIVQLGDQPATTVPNVRATQQPLFEGLVAAPVKGWPNLDLDFMALVGKAGGPAMPVGFYYKTFMWPASMWMTYEKYIRRAAGLGRAPQRPDPDRYDHLNHHCDVLVVGGGPAGLAAALAAGRRGARVILADEQWQWGGSLLHSRAVIDGAEASAWAAAAVAELETLAEVLLLPHTTAFGYHDHNFVTLVEAVTDGEASPQGQRPRQRLHRVRAKEVVLATGAHQRPLVYGNNDTPGNLLADAVSTYIRRYAVVPGKQLVVTTANDDGYRTALDWWETGREVVAVVDARPNPDGALVEAVRAHGIEVIPGSGVIEARGQKRVEGAVVAALEADAQRAHSIGRILGCDTIASAGGWSPVVHLACHLGEKPVWRDDILGFVPRGDRPGRWIAGGVNGSYPLGQVFAEGFAAGSQAAARVGLGQDDVEGTTPAVEEPEASPPLALFLVPHTLSCSRAPKQFVDLQNDVTAAGIELAVREGFESIEHVKRYTALGFGTDQGKLSNINGLAMVAKALNRSMAETGTTTFRPAYTPVAFGALAGHKVGKLFDPARFTPMHPWHVRAGAEFENVGQWKRPWYYPRGGESLQEAVNRECLAVRNAVGILDASTLGKIDIQGIDARTFLERVYTNAWQKLKPGRCRYGLMCKDDGMVFDDGVTSCLADDHFLMTTTTTGAAGVLQWLELWHQTEWPELKVHFTSVTDHFATATLSGPKSREVLARLCDDVDLSDQAFPFMSFRDITVAGVAARVFRISFTGELSFEINVQANYGHYVWEQLMAAGEPLGITPYGTETMHVLRAEKGFIIVGQDTDGSVTPQDLGMSWAIGHKKPFNFIGRRSWAREDSLREDRKQLVGLMTHDPGLVLPEGAQAVLDPKPKPPMAMVGHVTSSYYSATLGRSIALALIKGGHHRSGETLHFPLADGRTPSAEICSPVFYDPEGSRQHV